MKMNVFLKLIALAAVCSLLVGCAAGIGGSTTTTDKSTTTTVTHVTTTAPTTTVTTKTVTTTTVQPKQNAVDLMAKVSAKKIADKAVDDTFFNAYTQFALDFFKAAKNESGGDNILVSPLSVQLAMAMLANGASGNTQKEIEEALGGLSVGELNQYLYNYIIGLPIGEAYKLQLANVIWFNKNSNVNVKQSFLQTNANYYDASMYESVFNKQTVNEVNAWVKDRTNGMIDSVVEDLDEADVMLLINTLLFEADWQNTYGNGHLSSGVFTTQSGKERQVTMMQQVEEMKYITTADATGFAKPYKDGYYSFVALLPDKTVGIDQYIASLTVEKVQTALNSGITRMRASIPKFTYEYDADMNDILSDMDINAAFDLQKADFSGISESGGLYLDEVVHKTKIELSEEGTKAGAVTTARVTKSASTISVTLGRPFVYMIVDNTTDLPIFMGAVTDISE